MTSDRERVDLGVVDHDRLSEEQRRDLVKRLGAVAMAERVDANKPVATSRQRMRALNQMRRECGWTRPSRAADLAHECPHCGARAGGWCKRRGQPVVGRICDKRATSTREG